MWDVFHFSKRTKGIALPTFIRNGQYHYTLLYLYEDGTINAWGSFRQDALKAKLKSGWIYPAPPLQQLLSFFHLGSTVALDAEWTFSPDTLRNTLLELHKKLLPEKQYKAQTFASKELGPKPCKYDGEGKLLKGENVNVFEISGNKAMLQHLFVFADQTLRLGPAGPFCDIAAIEAMFDSGRLRMSPPEGSRIYLPGTGSFMPGESNWYVKADHLLLELRDHMNILTDEPGTIQQCRKAFNIYEANPDTITRAALKQAYEAVPEHLRIYCGDMDVKDAEICRAIYSN